MVLVRQWIDDAFLSYSHTEGRIAQAVQSGLQRLAKPWFRRPLIRIFRDQTSLSANPGLWSEIEPKPQPVEALHPAGLAGGRELKVGRTRGGAADRSIALIQNFLIVVTDGTIRWDAAATDFDWSATTCLPQALAGRLTERTMYVA